ncbi:hypothetical protein [Pseudonocardia sp. DLS-67]
MIDALTCRYRVHIVVATTIDNRYRRSRAAGRRLDLATASMWPPHQAADHAQRAPA